MNKILLVILVLLIALFGIYYTAQKEAPADLPTEDSVVVALQTAAIDVSEFGGDSVTLSDGQANFLTDPNDDFPRGFVGTTDKHAVIFKGEDADLYTVLNINGGGTGTFQYLVQFEYSHATKGITEVERVLLGDRIIIDGVYVDQTAPTNYSVLVALKERLSGEGMAAVPTQPWVLHYTHEAEGLELADVTFGGIEEPQVILVAPLPGATVGTTFGITGAARGTWFFEANIPVEVRNYDGDVIAQAPGTAEGDWMTEGMVPFTATVTLPTGTTGLHTLIIKKDNPSGLPEHDGSIEIPIVVD